MPTTTKKKRPAAKRTVAKAKTTSGRRVATVKPSTAGMRVEFSPDPSLRRALDTAARKRKVPKSVIIAEALRSTLGLGAN